MGLQARLTAAMVALVLLTALTVGLLTYRNVESTVLPRALDRLSAHVQLRAADLEASVRGARADVIGFRSANTIAGIVEATLAGGTHPVDHATTAQWAGRLATRFAAELAAKPTYYEYRVIAADGREIVRVDRTGPGETIRIVPENELPRQDERDYFQRAIRAAPGEVDVSPIELCRRGGVIRVPHVPIFRVSTPFFAPD